MRLREAVGYLLLSLGVVATLLIWTQIPRYLFGPSGGGLLAGLGLGILLLSFPATGLLLALPGSLLVRTHDSPARRLLGLVYVALPLVITFTAFGVVDLARALLIAPLIGLFHIPAGVCLLTGSGRALAASIPVLALLTLASFLAA